MISEEEDNLSPQHLKNMVPFPEVSPFELIKKRQQLDEISINVLSEERGPLHARLQECDRHWLARQKKQKEEEMRKKEEAEERAKRLQNARLTKSTIRQRRPTSHTPQNIPSNEFQYEFTDDMKKLLLLTSARRGGTPHSSRVSSFNTENLENLSLNFPTTKDTGALSLKRKREDSEAEANSKKVKGTTSHPPMRPTPWVLPPNVSRLHKV